MFCGRLTRLSCIRALAAALALAAFALIGVGATLAQEPSPLHPLFPLYDAGGQNVLVSGNPASPMMTCGTCHDTAFIATHNTHSGAALTGFTLGGGASFAPADAPFGDWNPLTYRYLSADDLSPDDWQRSYATRSSGGPDAVAGAGSAEINCFLCHTQSPDNAARIAALQAGDEAWAASATLLGSGLLKHDAGEWTWNARAFDADGNLRREYVTIQDPSNTTCGQCHGLAQSNDAPPLTLDDLSADTRMTITTGQVFSPQQMAASGINLAGKGALTRSWDIHAERLVECVDCHYAPNNPVYAQQSAGRALEHLIFDPRRLDLGEYLLRPDHEFAAQSPDQPAASAGRACASCHDAASTHEWLPYTDRHLAVVQCESCHVPAAAAPALQSVNWTALDANGSPATRYRGLEDGAATPETALVTGFQPALLPVERADGTRTLAPYNLIASWYWVYGEPARPVPLPDLQAAWFEDNSYAPDVLAAFDADGDGRLESAELAIDSDAKLQLIAGRLAGRGLETPRIVGEVRPYALHHGVAGRNWAIKDCQTCHSEDSRLAQPILLASNPPGGVAPTMLGVAGSGGTLMTGSGGQLLFASQPDQAGLYIFGRDRVEAVDLLGALLFLGVLAGAAVHGGLRYLAARRRLPREAEQQRVYMYSVYERQWHWLQTVVILILIFTGLIIHKPALFGALRFSYVVQVHNLMALILVVNAALSVFYHLVSGEIRQFLPEPHGFFNDAIVQAKFYLRGIFRGEGHPFEKQRARKLNPLQQVTYLAILNLLLPLQILTGALMWGAQRWPELAVALGGLPLLAPFHTLIAWLFASFIVLHIYLTTTGPTPLSNIQAMITGWDQAEALPASGRPAEEVSR